MDNLKPTQMMLIGGGAVLFLSTLLAWRSREGFDSIGGWSVSRFGFLGVFIGLIGLAIAIGVASQAFGTVSLPDRILSLDHDQLHLLLGVTAFVVTFGQQFADDFGIGIVLGWLASGTIVAAAVMDIRARPGTPTQF